MDGTEIPRQRHGRQYWQEVVEQQEASGQRVRSFCAENGIGQASFYAWRRRFRSPEKSAGSSCNDTGFVELRHEAAVGRGGILIRYGEFAIEVGNGFDDSMLRRVLCIARSVSVKSNRRSDF